MSLASDDAEDDGSHGNRSVPAMLRTIRECIHVHMDVVTQSRASLSTEILSTVMGSLKPGRLKESSREKLLEGFPSIKSLLSEIAEEGDEGELKAEAIRKDLHSLIRQAIEKSIERRTEKSVPQLMEAIDEQYFAKIQKSSESNLVRARGFAVQCLTLVAGQKAGQPWKREQAVKQFETHSKFLIEKLTCIQSNKKSLNEAREFSASLRRGTTLADQIQDSDLAEQLRRCDSSTTIFCANINSLTKEVLAEFNDGVYNFTSVNRSKELNVPNDVVEKSRGSWVRQELPN